MAELRPNEKIRRKPFAGTKYADELRVRERFWTPECSFATPGTSTWSYSTQYGKYYFVGKLCFYYVALVFTPTIGTGTGDFQISAPVNSKSISPAGSVASMTAGFTWPAGRTDVVPYIQSPRDYFILRANGTGVGASNFSSSNLTTATSHTLIFNGWYEADIDD